MSEIRIAQYFDIRPASGGQRRFQNYFVGQTKSLDDVQYDFAPFRADGSVANLNGDNAVVRVLFPATEFSIKLVEEGDGNRLSELTLTTQWLNAAEAMVRSYVEYYVGIGASFSETTVELRFRTAMDSVGAQFPARILTRSLVGLLPLNSDIVLQ